MGAIILPHLFSPEMAGYIIYGDDLSFGNLAPESRLSDLLNLTSLSHCPGVPRYNSWKK